MAAVKFSAKEIAKEVKNASGLYDFNHIRICGFSDGTIKTFRIDMDYCVPTMLTLPYIVLVEEESAKKNWALKDYSKAKLEKIVSSLGLADKIHIF